MSIEAQDVKNGDTATKPNDPTENEFAFKGWFADAEFKTEFDFGSAIKENTTIYAKWEENKVEPTDNNTTSEGNDKKQDGNDTTQDGKDTTQTEGIGMVWLWVAIGVVVIALAVTGFVLFKKKNSDNPTETEEQQKS